MAFGDLKGGVTAISVAANSITNPTDAVGSVAVVVGDLIFVVVGEQTSLTAGTVTDNLGNSYTATNAGTDAGTSTGRAYYSRVTVAGTLTTVHVAATGSTDNVAIVACVFTGPFAFSPLDANPSNITTQVTSPFTAPATGTLVQNSELVVSWAVATGSTVWSATSPNTLGAQLATQAILHSVIGYQTVSATTTVAPAFTAGSNPTDSVLGTNSFKQDPGVAGDTSYLQHPSSARHIPRTHLRDFSVQQTFQDDTSLARNPFRLIRTFAKTDRSKHDASQSSIDPGGPSTQTLTPSLYTNTNTFYQPTVNLQELPAGSVPAPRRRKLPVPRHKDESLAGSIAFNQTLTPSLYTNTNTFFTPVINLQELPAGSVPPVRRRVLPIPRHKEESRAGSTSFNQTLTPSLYTNTNTFYDSTLISLLQESIRYIRIRKRIRPPRPKDHTTSAAPSFPQTLSPPLYTNTNAFYAPIVVPLLQEIIRNVRLRRRDTTTKVHRDFSVAGNQIGGAQTLSPSLYTNTNTFYTPTVNLQELPAGSVPPPRKRILPIPRHKNESIAGSTSFDQTLTPSLYTNTNTFYTPTVTVGVVTLTPTLYTNVNTFYTPLVTLQEFPAFNILPVKRQRPTKVHRDHSVRATYIFDQTLTPDLFTNDNTFYSPTVMRAGANLFPDLYTNNNTFYTPTVTITPTETREPFVLRRSYPRRPNIRRDISISQTIGANQNLTPSLYINSNIFYSPTITTGSVSLDPSLYTNTDTFYVPVVSLQELPAASVAPVRRRILPIPRHKSESVSGSTSFDQTLTPSLYTNTNTFYQPTITTGDVTLLPTLYTNSDTFYQPIITLQELPAGSTPPIRSRKRPPAHRDFSIHATLIFDQSLFPSLFTNDNTFYNPTVSREGVNLFPSLYTNSNTFYSPTVTAGVVDLDPSLFTNTDTFYTSTVSLQELPASAVAPIRRRIRPRRYIDPSAGGTQLAVSTLHPSLYTNVDTFYTPVVGSTYTLHPNLFTNNNTFYTPIVLEGQALLPSLYTNSNTFYVPVITQGPAVLHPTLYTNINIFYVPSVVVPQPPPPPSIAGGIVGQGYRPPKIVNVTTNGILFTVPITLLPGAATTISLLPGEARIDVIPEIRPFMNSMEVDFTIIGTAKGTDILEDNMDDLMLILSQILLD